MRSGMAGSTRQRVLELHAQGHSGIAIAKQVGITKSTVSYHLRRAGENPDARFNRRYDWTEVQRYYDAGHSITDCQRRFGFARETWNDAGIGKITASKICRFSAPTAIARPRTSLGATAGARRGYRRRSRRRTSPGSSDLSRAWRLSGRIFLTSSLPLRSLVAS